MARLYCYAMEESAGYRHIRETLGSVMSRYNPIFLPCGSPFSSREWLALRSCDILLLYADTSSELDMLTAMREQFENYRILLLLNTNLEQLISQGLLLNPRYVATDDYLESVFLLIAEKMLGKNQMAD